MSSKTAKLIAFVLLVNLLATSTCVPAKPLTTKVAATALPAKPNTPAKLPAASPAQAVAPVAKSLPASQTERKPADICVDSVVSAVQSTFNLDHLSVANWQELLGAYVAYSAAMPDCLTFVETAAASGPACQNDAQGFGQMLAGFSWSMTEQQRTQFISQLRVTGAKLSKDCKELSIQGIHAAEELEEARTQVDN